MKSSDGIVDKESRRTWVEPDMIELNVSETANRPRFGRDGGNYADCQRS